MKRKIYLLFGLFVLISQLSNVHCQISTTRERVFTGAGLYGFMNGGADQFLEYGVYLLTSRDVVYKDESFTIDIYELPTPEDAFGIYSMLVFRCQRADTLGCIDCLSPYQLQAVAGNKYISVVFPSGSASAQRLADELIRNYLPDMDNAPQPSFPQKLVKEPPYSGVLKYVRGPISATNVSRDLGKILENKSYKGAWYRKEKGSNLFQVYILTEEDSIYLEGEEQEDDTPDTGPFGF